MKVAKTQTNGWSFGTVVFDTEDAGNPSSSPGVFGGLIGRPNSWSDATRSAIKKRSTMFDFEGISSVTGWFKSKQVGTASEAELELWHKTMGHGASDALKLPSYWDDVQDPVWILLYYFTFPRFCF